MSNPIIRLKSILSQASNINSPTLFFPLFHEFALHLTNPYFNEALKTIRAREEKMKAWIGRMPHKPTAEYKQLYYQQYRTVSDWYSLNQIMVFFERYDFAFHDVAIQDLTQKNEHTEQFRNEHYAMITYARTGICPTIFPTIEEYKHHMRRIVDALDEILLNSTPLTIYPFSFDQESNALLIEGYDPIQFTRNKNTSLLLGFLEENKWKSLAWTKVQKQLDFEPDTTKRTIRQINDRLPTPLPQFLSSPNHPSKLNEKIITVSGFYKKQ